MLLFFIQKTKRNKEKFEVEIRLLPLDMEERKKTLCEIFDIILAKGETDEGPPIDAEPPGDKMKLEK